MDQTDCHKYIFDPNRLLQYVFDRSTVSHFGPCRHWITTVTLSDKHYVVFVLRKPSGRSAWEKKYKQLAACVEYIISGCLDVWIVK